MNKKIQGFTTFTVSLLIMMILIGLSLFLAQVILADRRISINEVQYRQAFSLAEQGLSDALARLNQDKTLRTTGTQVTQTNGNYTFSISATPVLVGNTEIPRITVRSNASLGDNQAQSSVEVQLVPTSYIGAIPAATLSISGGANLGGTFTIVSNPNGGALGAPLSLWSNAAVNLTGSSQTCHAGDFNGSCTTNLSSSSAKKSDIKDLDPNFPSDLLQYVFNEPSTPQGLANLEKKATLVTTHCDNLNSTSTGIIIVKGNCTPRTQLGSLQTPILLLIKDGNLTVNSKTDIYGLVFAYSSNPASSLLDVSLNDGSIKGVFISNYRLDKVNGNFDASYNNDIINTIRNSPNFNGLAIIPGSWRDW